MTATGKMVTVAVLVCVILGFLSLFAICLLVVHAKKKRALYGTYSPQKHEFEAPRIEMAELKIKIPPEERLI